MPAEKAGCGTRDCSCGPSDKSSSQEAHKDLAELKKLEGYDTKSSEAVDAREVVKLWKDKKDKAIASLKAHKLMS